MELTHEEHRESLAPCAQGEHNFIPIGDPVKRDDPAKIQVGTKAFCTKCSNVVYIVLAEQSKITARTYCDSLTFSNPRGKGRQTNEEDL